MGAYKGIYGFVLVMLLMGCGGGDEYYNDDSGWESAVIRFNATRSPQKKDVVRLVKHSNDCRVKWLLVLKGEQVIVSMPLLDIANNSSGFKRAGDTAIRRCK